MAATVKAAWAGGLAPAAIVVAVLLIGTSPAMAQERPAAVSACDRAAELCLPVPDFSVVFAPGRSAAAAAEAPRSTGQVARPRLALQSRGGRELAMLRVDSPERADASLELRLRARHPAERPRVVRRWKRARALDAATGARMRRGASAAVVRRICARYADCRLIAVATVRGAGPEPVRRRETRAIPTAAERPAGSLGTVRGSTPRSGPGRLLRYSVHVEHGIKVDRAAFARRVRNTLLDPRGWGRTGRVAFQQVPSSSEADARVILAGPALVDRLCAPLETRGYVSCSMGGDVVLNVERWRHAVPHWPSGRRLSYRWMLINHEIGHLLGHGHRDCPGPGERAPVMQQQTFGLQGCRPGPWPTDAEIDATRGASPAAAPSPRAGEAKLVAHLPRAASAAPAGTQATPAAPSIAVGVSTTAPGTTIDSGPEGRTRGGRPTFTFSSDDPEARFECRFSSRPFGPCSGPGRSHRPAERLAPGPNAFEVRALSAGGIADPTPARRAFEYRPPLRFELLRTSVAPRRMLFDGRLPARIRYRFRAARPVDVRIEIVRVSTGRVVERFVQGKRRPRTGHLRRWGGLRRNGKPAPDGRYAVRIGPRGGRGRAAGRLTLHGHVFPVRGRHGSRGAIGRFGAERSGGRRHEGYDILAACGTPLVAARGGRVTRAAYDPVLHGHFVHIRGRGESRTYVYSHLRSSSPARSGHRVRTGDRIGVVGQTGNARFTPCHLHFEIRTPRGPIDPLPELRRWAGR